MPLNLKQLLTETLNEILSKNLHLMHLGLVEKPLATLQENLRTFFEEVDNQTNIEQYFHTKCLNPLLKSIGSKTEKYKRIASKRTLSELQRIASTEDLDHLIDQWHILNDVHLGLAHSIDLTLRFEGAEGGTFILKPLTEKNVKTTQSELEEYQQFLDHCNITMTEPWVRISEAWHNYFNAPDHLTGLYHLHKEYSQYPEGNILAIIAKEIKTQEQLESINLTPQLDEFAIYSMGHMDAVLRKLTTAQALTITPPKKHAAVTLFHQSSSQYEGHISPLFHSHLRGFDQQGNCNPGTLNKITQLAEQLSTIRPPSQMPSSWLCSPLQANRKTKPFPFSAKIYDSYNLILTLWHLAIGKYNTPFAAIYAQYHITHRKISNVQSETTSLPIISPNAEKIDEKQIEISIAKCNSAYEKIRLACSLLVTYESAICNATSNQRYLFSINFLKTIALEAIRQALPSPYSEETLESIEERLNGSIDSRKPNGNQSQPGSGFYALVKQANYPMPMEIENAMMELLICDSRNPFYLAKAQLNVYQLAIYHKELDLSNAIHMRWRESDFKNNNEQFIYRMQDSYLNRFDIDHNNSIRGAEPIYFQGICQLLLLTMNTGRQDLTRKLYGLAEKLGFAVPQDISLDRLISIAKINAGTLSNEYNNHTTLINGTLDERLQLRNNFLTAELYTLAEMLLSSLCRPLTLKLIYDIQLLDSFSRERPNDPITSADIGVYGLLAYDSNPYKLLIHLATLGDTWEKWSPLYAEYLENRFGFSVNNELQTRLDSKERCAFLFYQFCRALDSEAANNLGLREGITRLTQTEMGSDTHLEILMTLYLACPHTPFS